MSNRYATLIQPEALRAPEVILGAEWDTKTDIWNIGALVSRVVLYNWHMHDSPRF